MKHRCPGCKRAFKTNKRLAYGEQRKLHWCDVCDGQLVTPVNKGRARADGKKEIKKQLSEHEAITES